MNNISFKGDKAANSPNETEAVLNSPLLKTDENGQTFFHKASVEDLKARKQKITPQLLKIALSMQDWRGDTCLHYTKGPEFINIIVDILGDEAPEVLSKVLALKNDNGDTFLHYNQYPETLEIYAKALKDKAPEVFADACLTRNNIGGEAPIFYLIDQSNRFQKSLDESKVVFRTLGDKTTEIIRNYRNERGGTIFHWQLKPELAQIIIDNMGDKAPEVLSEMLPMQNNAKETFLHCKQDPKTLNIYAKALKDKAPEVFANACFARDDEGEIPILDLICYNNQGQEKLNKEKLNKSKVVFKALGDKTTEIIRKYRDKFGCTVFHYELKPEIAQTIVDSMGDKAPEVLSEMLSIQDDSNRTFLHCDQYPETLEIYAKALKNKAPKVFANACLAKDNEGEVPIYNLVHYLYLRQRGLDVSKVVFKALGKKTAEVIRKYRNKYGRTIFHEPVKPKIAQTIVDSMGDKASEVLSEMLPIQDDAKETFLNCYHYQQYPETLEIYAKALKDKAPETFAKACLVRDNEGETPILNLIYYSNRSQESLDASKVVFRALGDKTTEVIEDYIGRFRINIFRYRIEPELAQIIVDNMGDDEAQQVLSEILPLRDNSNRTFLHYSQYLETIKIYAKALKDKAPETFAKAYPAEIIDKISYGYNARKLIHAIIAGEKV